LIAEAAPRMPRDATLLAVLPDVSVETALTLGNLRRRGMAVTVVLVRCDANTYERSVGRLLSEGLKDVRHLKNEASLPDLCGRQMMGMVEEVAGDAVEESGEAFPGMEGRTRYQLGSAEE